MLRVRRPPTGGRARRLANDPWHLPAVASDLSTRPIRKCLLLHVYDVGRSASWSLERLLLYRKPGKCNCSTKMLRITVHDYPGAVVLLLEGRVAVPWLLELEKCWLRIVASQDKPVLTFDVTGVTFIDAAGKAFLTAMHRKGATFVARDCLTKSILEEIVRTSPR